MDTGLIPPPRPLYLDVAVTRRVVSVARVIPSERREEREVRAQARELAEPRERLVRVLCLLRRAYGERSDQNDLIGALMSPGALLSPFLRERIKKMENTQHRFRGL